MADQHVREMIEARLAEEGWTAREWREGEDGLEAVVGRFVVIEGDNDTPPYIDTEGELTACVVGSPERHNERVHFSFTEDGMDAGDEVSDLTTLEPADA